MKLIVYFSPPLMILLGLRLSWCWSLIRPRRWPLLVLVWGGPVTLMIALSKIAALSPQTDKAAALAGISTVLSIAFPIAFGLAGLAIIFLAKNLGCPYLELLLGDPLESKAKDLPG